VKRITSLVLFSAAITITVLDYAGNILATPAVGFVTTTVASGRFGELDLLHQTIIPESTENDRRAKVWLSLQKPGKAADLYVQSNVWQPGGSTGWHTHPGHSLIIVTAGAVTEYEGLDPDCKPHVYTTNMAFGDPHGDPHDDSHGDHAHIIRNEGNVVAQTTAVQLIPAGAARRIDVADPGNCHF
jgi:hypothetical protein